MNYISITLTTTKDTYGSLIGLLKQHFDVASIEVHAKDVKHVFLHPTYNWKGEEDMNFLESLVKQGYISWWTFYDVENAEKHMNDIISISAKLFEQDSLNWVLVTRLVGMAWSLKLKSRYHLLRKTGLSEHETKMFILGCCSMILDMDE